MQLPQLVDFVLIVTGVGSSRCLHEAARVAHLQNEVGNNMFFDVRCTNIGTEETMARRIL